MDHVHKRKVTSSGSAGYVPVEQVDAMRATTVGASVVAVRPADATESHLMGLAAGADRPTIVVLSNGVLLVPAPDDTSEGGVEIRCYFGYAGHTKLLGFHL